MYPLEIIVIIGIIISAALAFFVAGMMYLIGRRADGAQDEIE